MCLDSPDYIDRISFQLPLMKQMGDSLQVKVTSVRPYEAFHDDLKVGVAVKRRLWTSMAELTDTLTKNIKIHLVQHSF